MKFLVNSIYFYFLLPIYLALLALLVFFNIPKGFYPSIFAFFLIITAPVVLTSFYISARMQISDYYKVIQSEPNAYLVVLFLCFIIMALAPADILINGFKLLKPKTYAEFHGPGRYIRHITALCWIFIPVAFIFVKNTPLKIIFISYAILFPILIVDRTRLFVSFYALFLCMILSHTLDVKRRPRRFKLLPCLIPVICLIIFCIIGKFKNGNDFIVSSSGTSLIKNSYPLKDIFFQLPLRIQQIVLYLTTPIFNFATVNSYDFLNQDFLLRQFSPFSREKFDLYPHAPVLVPKFNVGTEFYPFLLYGGLPLVAHAFLFLLFTFHFVVYLLKKYPNIFTFLIFVKISYSVLFMGFAPQFYMLLNLSFCTLMLFLWFITGVLKAVGAKLFWKSQKTVNLNVVSL